MTDEATVPAEGRSGKGKPKKRSPEHPLFDLKRALARATTLYDKEDFRWANATVALKHLGFDSTKSSTGIRTLAALKHFGLIDDLGQGAERKVKLSELARKILRDQRPESRERDAAIQQAALKPDIYAKIWKKWGEHGRLPSVASMTYELEHEFDFNPEAIPGFVRDFVSTLRYAKLDKTAAQEQIGDDTGDGQDDPDTEKNDAPRESPANATIGRRMSQTQGAPETRIDKFKIPLLDGASAIFEVPVPMSKANLKRLIAWLEFNEPAITYEDGA